VFWIMPPLFMLIIGLVNIVIRLFGSTYTAYIRLHMVLFKPDQKFTYSAHDVFVPVGMFDALQSAARLLVVACTLVVRPSCMFLILLCLPPSTND